MTAGPEERRPKLELTFRQQVNQRLAAQIELAFSARWERPPTDDERDEILAMAKVMTRAEADVVCRWLVGPTGQD